MYKMVIVDDERIIVNGLHNCIDWSLYGIQIAGEAFNGREALELIEATQPQIVFTDIRMPLMDGLSLVRELRARGYHDIKVVVLSGYEEFEYAQQALKLGAVDYLLKPTCPENIDLVIKKVIGLCRQEEQKKLAEEAILYKISKMMPLLVDKYLNDVLHGVLVTEADIREQSRFLGIELGGSQFMALVMAADRLLPGSGQAPERDRQLTQYALYGIAEEVIRSEAAGFVVSNSQYGLPVILKFPADTGAEPAKAQAMQVITRLKEAALANLGITVTIGVGGLKQDLARLRQSFEESINALSYRISLGEDTVIFLDDLGQQANATLRYPAAEIKLLNDALKMKDRAELEKGVANLFREIAATPGVTIDYVEQVCQLILSVTTMTLLEMGEDLAQFDDDQPGPVQMKFGQFTDISQIEAWFREFFARIIGNFEERLNGKKIRLCNQIRDYISQHFAEEITLNDISQQFFLTPNYLCTIFKNTIGKSFKEYLTAVRIAKAQELMRENQYSMAEIAEQVGYKNYEHFRKVFKEATGVNPSNY